MPIEQVKEARIARNSALIEAMLLAAISDGRISEIEMRTLLTRVLERPEFEGTKPEELNQLVETSAAKLSEAHDLDEILRSLRARLPDHQNRMLAFGLAAAVAFADQRATRAELGLLKTFQAALGISEEEVIRIIDVIEHGGSLSEALGEPLERLYAEVMVLISAADGKLKDEEARAMVESLASDPVFAEVTPERAQTYVSESVTALASEGLPRRVQALAAGLTTHRQRLRAFGLAAKVAVADGAASPNEQRVLNLLQATFGIDDEEVSQIQSKL